MLQSPGHDSTGYLPAVQRVEAVIPMNLRQDYVGVALNATTGNYLALAMVSDPSVVANPGFVSGNVDVIFSDN